MVGLLQHGALMAQAFECAGRVEDFLVHVHPVLGIVRADEHPNGGIGECR